MGTHYFSTKKKNEPSIVKILVGILLVFALVILAVYGIKNVSLPGSSAKLMEQAPGMLATAQAHLQAQEYDAAQAAIALLMAKAEDPVITPLALLLQADIELAQNKDDLAAQHLKKILDSFATSPSFAQASVKYAELLNKQGRNAEATQVYQELKQNAPPQVQAEGLLAQAQKLQQEGKSIEARDQYKQALAQSIPETELWNKVLDAYGNLNVELVFSPKETPESKFHSVEKGDSITSIGNKLNTTQGMLLRANGLTELSRLNLGQRLKITPEEFRILIDRATCRLFLFDQNGIFKRYYVGLGMPGFETAPGKYTIGNKQKDPVWHKPGAGPIPAGDPANELGTRWMPLVPADRGLPTDLGIHGTIAPETIGLYKSHGCPRMKKEDVEELYDLVVRATPVEIVEKAPESALQLGGAVAEKGA